MSNKLNGLDLATIKMGFAQATDSVATVKQQTKKMQEAVRNFNALDLNEFIEEYANKVLSGSVFKGLQFQDKFSKNFFQEGTTYSAAHEISDVKLLESAEYNHSDRYLSHGKHPKGLRVVIPTKAKRYIQYSFMYDVVQAAFASPESYTKWYQRVVQNLNTTLQVELYKELQAEVIGSVINEVDASGITSWDELLLKLNEVIAGMSLPTDAYNIGYQSKFENGAIVKFDNSKDDLRRINTSSISDLVLITTPSVLNAIKGRVLSSKIHNSYFKMEKFADIITLPEDVLKNGGDNFMYVVDKEAFYGRFRIYKTATQNWAANLETDIFLHYWYLFGMIPWANGFKFKFQLPTIDNTITIGKLAP